MKVRSSQSGQALWIVITVLLILAPVIFVITNNANRMSKLSQLSNQKQDFRLLDQRLKNIFEAVDLCTCNLRGILP